MKKTAITVGVTALLTMTLLTAGEAQGVPVVTKLVQILQLLLA